MADLNLYVCTGRLGRDPESRHLPSGEMVCNFSLAVGKKWRDKASGENREQTTWVRFSAFGKTAELIAQYAVKGSQLRVTGELTTRNYMKGEVEVEAVEIRVQDFQLLGGRPDGAPAPAQRPAAARQRQAAAPRQAPAADGFDDDIPF